MRIGEPARKWGVSDDDIHHVYRNPMRRREGTNGMTLLIGAGIDGRLLEVAGYDLHDEDKSVILHAMPLRASFYKYL